MWNHKESSLDLLGELGTVELNTLSKCYVFRKFIRKVNLPTLPIELAYRLFDSDNKLKVGKLIIYFDYDEVMANLTLDYQVSLSEKALGNTFSKLYSGIKEDLNYLEDLSDSYKRYADNLLKSMSTKDIDKLDAVKKSLDNLNIKEDNNEN